MYWTRWVKIYGGIGDYPIIYESVASLFGRPILRMEYIFYPLNYAPYGDGDDNDETHIVRLYDMEDVSMIETDGELNALDAYDSMVENMEKAGITSNDWSSTTPDVMKYVHLEEGYYE